MASVGSVSSCSKQDNLDVKGAVAAGKISREKVGLLWVEIEKAEAGTRLPGAVEKGELTEEEARDRWAEINEKDDDEGDKHQDEDGDEDKEDSGRLRVIIRAAWVIDR